MNTGTPDEARQKWVSIVLIAAVALILGFWLSTHWYGKKVVPANTVFSPPIDIPSFQLTDTNGRPFTHDSLQGQWTIMFFGFTNCPQICPTTMAELNQMYQLLVSQKQSTMPQVVMISIDPDTDTLSKLQQYVTSFNPNFLGATGSKEEVSALAKALNIVYMKVKTSENPNGYTIDHSGAVLLVDPSGRLIMLFSPPIDPKVMANDYNLITSSSG